MQQGNVYLYKYLDMEKATFDPIIGLSWASFITKWNLKLSVVFQGTHRE